MTGQDHPIGQEIAHAKGTALQGALSEGQFQKYRAAKEEMRKELEQKLAKKVDAGGS